MLNEAKTLSNLKVYVTCTYAEAGRIYCYVDNIRLINEPARYVEYKNTLYASPVIFGKTVTIKKRVKSFDGVKTVIQEKNASYDVVKTTIIDTDGNEFCSYAQYDDEHRLIYSQDYRGIITKYTYNSVGMVTSVKSWHCTELNPSTIAEPTEFSSKQ